MRRNERGNGRFASTYSPFPLQAVATKSQSNVGTAVLAQALHGATGVKEQAAKHQQGDQ